MNIKTNKIIAREFLFMSFSILVLVGIFTGIYFYNYLLNKKVNNINKNIGILQHKADSLFGISMAYYGAIGIDENGTPLKNQNFVIKEYTKEGIPIFDKTKICATLRDTINHDKALAINTEVENNTKLLKETKLSILSDKNRTMTSLKAFLFLIFILFVLRYFYYALKWSIKTIKQKS